MLKKPGLRIIKTGLAVILSMLISEIRPGDGLAFYSAIAAIICMQQNVKDTYHKGLGRVIGTIFGGLVGLVYLILVPQASLNILVDYLIISIVATIIIWILASLGMKNAVSIAAIVFLSVAVNHSADSGGIPVAFAINRVVDTLIGVLMAMAVNFVDFKIRKEHNKASIS